MLHALLCLLPIVAVAAPLLARRYPGERALLALRATRRPRVRRRPSRAISHGRAVVVQMVRGGRLLGCSLAVRPPPALLLAS